MLAPVLQSHFNEVVEFTFCVVGKQVTVVVADPKQGFHIVTKDGSGYLSEGYGKISKLQYNPK